MDKLILLVGASGSGKTTIAKELEKKGFNIIHSYTTREPREPNEWGHMFININTEPNEDNIFEFIGVDFRKWNDSPIIAYFENYNAIYFATKEQYQGKGTSIYVIDPKGAEEVKRNVRDAEVVTIYLQCDRQHRHYRMLGDTNRSVSEVEVRLMKDIEIFKVVKCDYVVDGNRVLKEVLEDVLEIIE